jgi:hypothetical protein
VGLLLGQADITFEEFRLELSADLPTHLKVNPLCFLDTFHFTPAHSLEEGSKKSDINQKIHDFH